jgi:hypothetical protein
MKIKDIITEGNNSDLNNDGIPDSHQTATPGLRSHHKLDNSSPYAPWRFAAYFLAGAGDKSGEYEHEPSKVGPNGQALVAAAYTAGERAILDQAAKAFGAEADHLQLTPDGSSEVKDVNIVSVVVAQGPIQRITKKK